MSEIVTFRSLTPVFGFRTSDDSPFTHSGTYKDANYSISLKQVPQGKQGFDELMALADNDTHNELTGIHISENGNTTDYFLIVDVKQPLTEDREKGVNTQESLRIGTQILTALRLHSTKGVNFEKTYNFRQPQSTCRFSISSPLARHCLFGHLGNGASVLHSNHFEMCRNTFDLLLNRQLNQSGTFDKLLNLALEYHQTAFTLVRVEHAFLIVMVIFEALFKKEIGNASQASVRIAKLLSEVQADKSPIQCAFYDHDTDAFCKIRNKIAHGDPALDSQMVKSKYPGLYLHVTNAILRLIDLPVGTIVSNYYDDVTAYINNRFSDLPEN